MNKYQNIMLGVNQMSDDVNKKIKILIDEYLKEHSFCGIPQYFRCIHSDLYQYIFDNTSVLDKKYPFGQRLFWIVNNITTFPLCAKCNKENKRIINYNEGYSGAKKYCCHKCAVSSEECMSKRRNTNIKNLGVAYPVQSEVIKQKIKDTCVEHFGSECYLNSDVGKQTIADIVQSKYHVDHISKSKEWRDKMSQNWKDRTENEISQIVSKTRHTKLERYGDENYSNREQAIETNIQRFGVPHAMQNQEVQEKSKETCLKKFGTEYCLQNKEVREKCKQTNLKKRGVEYPTQSEEVKEKCKNTSLLHFGVEYPLQSDTVKEKSKETCLKKYHAEYVLSADSNISSNIIQAQRDKFNGLLYSQTEEYKQRMIKLNQKKFGTDWGLQSKEIREKSKQTLINRFGVDNIFKSEIYKEKIRLKKLCKTYQRLLTNESIQPLFTLEEFLENPFNPNFKWRCCSCGDIFESPRSGTLRCENSLYARCYKCYPSEGHSVCEIEVSNILKQFCDDIIIGDHSIVSPKEIDIYIPSKKLAIEFDGLYWHSNQMLCDDKKYHYNKTEICESNDIQLIHIFEDEWSYKKDIVKSRLLNLIGHYDNIVYARQCVIRKVSFNDSKDFLNSNHIQGSCNSSIRYGLYYNNELISIMTFGPFRRSLGRKTIDNHYEMLRFCCKLGYHIPGAASKLFKHFVSDYKPIKVISYADRRWSRGKLYESLGFNFIRKTEPDYWYIIGYKREHRFAWRKSVLSKKLPIFDSNKTEYDNMLDNKIDCIYDCGNLLYEWNS